MRMTSQDEFHQNLKNKVEEAKRNYDEAVALLAAYERMFQGDAAPQPGANSVPLTAHLTPAKPVNVAPSPEESGSTKGGKKPSGPKPHTLKPAAAAPKPTNGTTKPAGSTSKESSRPGPKPGSKRTDTPSLIHALQLVMVGEPMMNAEEAKVALEAKGWLPESKDQIGYIRYTLSSKKEIFLRVPDRRGFYRLDPAKVVPPFVGSTPTLAAAPESSSPAPNAAAQSDDSSDNLDDLLTKSGINITEPNPFASA